MFPSIFATSSWITPGTYYNAPVRNWGFDYNFTHQNLLPPMAPCSGKDGPGQLGGELTNWVNFVWNLRKSGRLMYIMWPASNSAKVMFFR